ncbi:aryl-sulfate sulfotransferase [Salinigranum sp. GCM10025319]|uniref:aryl-sulfate sulfotransferase n=1 Tax=Salinigranum sp. GCM10025319 TaxID=3252687 RepID=UPI0036096CD9
MDRTRAGIRQRLRSDSTIRRLMFGALLVAFLLPSAIGVATYASPAAESEGATNAQNVTFVSTQGTSTQSGAGVYAIDTESKDVVWSYTECPDKCFDVDPLSNDTVLFVGKTEARKPWNITNSSTYNWKATHMNWRTGEVIAEFSVPIETHDVDFLGNGQYVVANKVNHDGAESKWVAEAKRQGWIDGNRSTHSHLLYVYDRNRDEIIWEYRFVDHYPRSAGDGYENDYTHVNDVDAVQNGSAFLTSPREFDRVLLINRSTKETEWELGEEDDYDVLHEQHNPVLLSSDPPTVLVADSENDRIVEYQRVGDEWERTWMYASGLDWPRDADRLPNGNTMIADSGNDRVLEVTPNGEVVWEYNISRGPYDIERLRYGDEPQGPPMSEIEGAPTQAVTEDSEESSSLQVAFEEYYFLAGWVLPPGVGTTAFVSLHGALLKMLVWGRYEWRDYRS